MKHSKYVAIKHSGQLGDIVYSLPFIKAILAQNGLDQAVLYITAKKRANHAKGLRHIGGDFMISTPMFDFIYPLLARQSYIREVLFEEEPLIPPNAIDLDLIRNGNVNLSSGNIRTYYFKFFGVFDCISGPWIYTDYSPNLSPDIVIGRSTRYLNLSIDYGILNEFNVSIGFLGTRLEYEKFIEISPKSRATYLPIDNALLAASVIKSCKLYIGNQSLFFALAEALDHPRLLESYEPVPNVVPSAGRSGTFLTTEALVKMATQVLRFEVAITVSENPPNYLLSF